MFTAVLGITKHKTSAVDKVLLQGEIPREKRDGDSVSNKTVEKKTVRNVTY